MFNVPRETRCAIMHIEFINVARTLSDIERRTHVTIQFFSPPVGVYTIYIVFV